MKELYQKILNKPENYRRRLAYAITAFIGVAAFSIWLPYTMKSTREKFNFSEEGTETVKGIKNTMPSLQFENMEKLDDLFPEENPPAENNSAAPANPAATTDENKTAPEEIKEEEKPAPVLPVLNETEALDKNQLPKQPADKENLAP